jgi:hypothetical protein
MRSGYSTAYGLGIGTAEGKTSAWCADLKKMLEEYREIQPFMYGDFYPLLPYSPDRNGMAAMQWDRPDQKSGIALVMRRPECLKPNIELSFRALDPKARYHVEIRAGLAKGPATEMSGEALAHLQITIAGKPGSAVVFYSKI